MAPRNSTTTTPIAVLKAHLADVVASIGPQTLSSGILNSWATRWPHERDDSTGEDHDAQENSKKRKRQSDDTSPDAIWQSWKEKLCHQGRKQLVQAVETPVYVNELDMLSHVTNDQSMWSKYPFPKLQQRREGRIASRPVFLVDRVGVPLAYIIPGWLDTKAHDSLFDLLMQLGGKIGLEQVKGVKSKAPTLRGVLELVAPLKATGRSREPGQSEGVTKQVATFSGIIPLLSDLKMLPTRLDDLYSALDPAQYEHVTLASEELKKRDAPLHATLSAFHDSLFRDLRISYDRDPDAGADPHIKKLAWTPLVTVGNYTKGTLQTLGCRAECPPGTLLVIRGGIVPHQLVFEAGQSICIAPSPVRADIFDKVEPGPLPIERHWYLKRRIQKMKEDMQLPSEPKKAKTT